VVPHVLVLAHGVVAPAGGETGAEGAPVSAVITEVLSTDKTTVIVSTDTVITVTNNITTDTIAVGEGR
jgi:hypothetical protein